MKNELDSVKEIIRHTKHFLEMKDYDGLKIYLDEQEKFLNNYRNIDKEEEYIEKLIEDLK